MGLKCKYEHVERPVGDIGGNAFHIDLNLVTDDENIYQRVVVAISNALGYPMVEKSVEKPILGFHMEPGEAEVGEEDSE